MPCCCCCCYLTSHISHFTFHTSHISHHTIPHHTSCRGDWSECSKDCGGGYSKRTPTVRTAAAYGGSDCPPEEEKACNTNYCAVDCEMGEWGQYSTCSEQCGEGTQDRTREVHTQAAYGGKECGPEYGEQNCNDGPCAVDCEHEWGGWGSCSEDCGGGYKSRHPVVKTMNQYGGKACPGSEQAVCNEQYCAIDCKTSDWSGWSDCSEACGDGVKYNTREVYTKSEYGGKSCPSLRDEANCMDKYCPVHCDYGQS